MIVFRFRLIEQQITSIDLASFTRKLRQVRERLGRTQGSIVGPAIDNEALFLDQMEQVQMKQKLDSFLLTIAQISKNNSQVCSYLFVFKLFLCEHSD